MKRAGLLKKLEEYQPQNEREDSLKRRFIGFVEREPKCFERSLSTGHCTGSAWLLNPTGTHVLLTEHRKLGKWLQLGGHADGDADLLAVALREAKEESGLLAIEPVSEAIFDLDIHSIPARYDEPEHLHYDARFLLQLKQEEELQISHESFDLRWIPLTDQHTITEESLVRMVSKTFSQFKQ